MRFPAWFGRRTQRGSQSLEAAIVLPAMVLFIGLLLFGARVVQAKQAVTAAAQAGARAASIERSSSLGRTSAQEVAAANLTNTRTRCTPQVAVKGNWNAPIGQAASIDATVRCRISMGDLVLPGVPGSITVSATRSSPLDRYRER
ncbi:MAG: pilus assembly protein [Propionibacteriales bacterium]|nr:pilus assembly protein [Propionibacteriales bacterium]